MKKADFQELLFAWYESNRRILPWRESKEPYRIWVSEIMLQQTRVKAAQPYFERFIAKFPTVQSLAQADEQDLLKYWEGLGFYRRVFNMQKTAVLISQKWAGRFPADYETLLHLPGIGPYTAAAISSIAFEQKQPVLDGNVMRVIARFFSVSENIMEGKTKKKLAELLHSIFPDERFGDFNQAMMELGSLVCLPKNPSCSTCPLKSFCQAFKQNLQMVIPHREPKIKVKKSRRYHFICQFENQFLLNKRPKRGLLANFWEFPGVEAANLEKARTQFRQKYGIDLPKMNYLFSYKHIFSHRIWQIRVYHVSLQAKIEDFTFVSKDELAKIALPTAFKKMRDFIIPSEEKAGEKSESIWRIRL
jgi:A/G-specific adenine glycosylase